MNRILHTVLLVLFTLYVQSGPLAWVVYMLQPDAVSLEQCVNLKDPVCLGRCYVEKILRDQQRQKESGPSDRVLAEQAPACIPVHPAGSPPAIPVVPVSYAVIRGITPLDGFPSCADYPPRIPS